MKKIGELLISEFPWEVGEDDKNGQAVVRTSHLEVCTCWHHCVGSIEKEMRGNAKLIAVAPEMAFILLSAYNHVTHGGPTRGDLHKILRKAGII